MARKPLKFQAMSVAELVQLRDEIQTALSGKIQMERDELGKSSTTWRAWRTQRRRGWEQRRRHPPEGRLSKRRVQAANGKAGRRKRKPVSIQYYDPETGSTYSNRGPMARWLRDKQEAGENIEKKYRVSKSNPLPSELAHLTPPG